MEQLVQLKTMRDDAAKRLDAARAAIEVSPDAKLFNSLTSLIEDLEVALGGTEEIKPAKDTKAKPAATPEPISEPKADNFAPAKEVVKETSAKVEKSTEMSLEESLEAELLADSNDLTTGKTKSGF
jgi:hypothetical protein